VLLVACREDRTVAGFAVVSHLRDQAAIGPTWATSAFGLTCGPTASEEHCWQPCRRTWRPWVLATCKAGRSNTASATRSKPTWPSSSPPSPSAAGSRIKRARQSGGSSAPPAVTAPPRFGRCPHHHRRRPRSQGPARHPRPHPPLSGCAL